MLIETSTELEILAVAHALLFDENNKRNGQTATGQSFVNALRNFKQASYVNQAINSLHVKKAIIAKRSSIQGVPEMEYGQVELTELGEKIVKLLIEPYWFLLPAWKTKYPNLKEQLIPELKEADDWLIMKTLFDNVKWQENYKIDDTRAGDIVDAIKEPPFFQRFINKLRSGGRVIQFTNGQDANGKHVDVYMLQPRCKPIVTENFQMFKTVSNFYKALTKMYRPMRSMNPTTNEFINLLMNHYEGERPDPEILFDHLASGDLIHLNPYLEEDKTSDCRITLQHYAGNSDYSEWEKQFLRMNYNPQSNFYSALDYGSRIEFNERTNDLRIKEKKQRSVINDAMTALEYSGLGLETSPVEEPGDQVFIVHGHDYEILNEVRQFIFDLGLTPVVLHEQPNQGKTLIEKLEKHSEQVGFAVVILTPDDTCLSKAGETKRARQNVIFELGFFINAVGRDRVCPLYKTGVEKPSDYDGVGYVELDSDGKWKKKLMGELKAAGFTVNEAMFSKDENN